MTKKIKLKVIEKLILKYVNKARTKNGIHTLKSNSGLKKLARKHSSEMAKFRRIWHGDGVHLAKSSISKNIFEILLDIISFFTISFGGNSGENVAMMPLGIVKGIKKTIKNEKDIAYALHITWMKSRGHRKNALNSAFSKVGIGVKRNKNSFYATQIFYG